MPHLNWSTFRGGIVQFATKSKREKLLATGSFGGFRSTAFISALLQIYFSIGFNDDILPNAEHEYSKGIHGTLLKLKNVRNKVQQAIKALLDVYFDCKRKEWKPDYLNAFERKLTVMEVHLKLVWELKQALVNAQTSETMPVKMRNLHKHIHLPIYIKTFGSLLHLDTSTYESFHKVATTAIWQRTSKRHNGLFQEMINNIIQHDFHRLHDIANQIVTKGLNYADGCSSIDGVRFQRIMNTSAFAFLLAHDDSNFCTDCDNYDKQKKQQYWKSVCVQTCLNSPEKLRSFLLKYHFGQAISHAYPSIKWDPRFAVNYETKIIQGISFSSDEQSQMGKGTIYATARYNRNDSRDDHVDKPRHDFVFIEFGNNTPVLARILMIIAIEKVPDDNDLNEKTTEGEEDVENTIMLLVQLLSKIEHGTRDEIIPGIGDLYEWAAGETSTSFCYDITAVQTIVRPVLAIPVFREGYNQTRPSNLDRFIAIDRNYFDRSGWIENDSASASIVSDQVNYLNSNQTGRMLVTIARDEVAEEQNIVDSMEDEDDDAAGIILDDSSSDDINISDNEDY